MGKSFYRINYQISNDRFGQYTSESAKEIIDWVASAHGGTLHITSAEKVDILGFVELINEADAEKNEMPEMLDIEECAKEFFEYADSLGVGGLFQPAYIYE